MLDMNLWYCVKYIIPPTSGVCLGTGQKAHQYMYTEQYILPTAWLHALHSKSPHMVLYRSYSYDCTCVLPNYDKVLLLYSYTLHCLDIIPSCWKDL